MRTHVETASPYAHHVVFYYYYFICAAPSFCCMHFCIISLDCSVCSICWLTLTINLLFCNTYASTRQRTDVISALLFRTWFFSALILSLLTVVPLTLRFIWGFLSILFAAFEIFVWTAVEKHAPQMENVSPQSFNPKCLNLTVPPSTCRRVFFQGDFPLHDEFCGPNTVLRAKCPNILIN